MSRDAGHDDLAFRRANLSVDQLQEGGFASAARADEKGELAWSEGQVDVIEGAPGSVNLAHGPEFDDRAHFPGGVVAHFSVRDNGARREYLFRR